MKAALTQRECMALYGVLVDLVAEVNYRFPIAELVTITELTDAEELIEELS